MLKADPAQERVEAGVVRSPDQDVVVDERPVRDSAVRLRQRRALEHEVVEARPGHRAAERSHLGREEERHRRPRRGDLLKSVQKPLGDVSLAAEASQTGIQHRLDAMVVGLGVNPLPRRDARRERAEPLPLAVAEAHRGGCAEQGRFGGRERHTWRCWDLNLNG